MSINELQHCIISVSKTINFINNPLKNKRIHRVQSQGHGRSIPLSLIYKIMRGKNLFVEKFLEVICVSVLDAVPVVNHPP
jgi:predicted transcriptional regulator